MKSELFDILRTFSKKEMREFGDMVISPFFNKSKSVASLYSVIKKHYPEFKSEELSKEKLFMHVYPEKKYNEATIKSAEYNLKQLAKKYLEITGKQGVLAGNDETFIGEAADRGLYKTASKKMDILNESLKSKAISSDEEARLLMEYEMMKIKMYFRMDNQESAIPHMQKRTQYLICYFLIRLATFIYDLRVNSLIFNSKYKEFYEKFISQLDLNEILEEIENSSIDRPLIIKTKIYVLWLLNLIHEDSEEYYREMKSLFLKNIELFNLSDKYDLFQALEAICWRKQSVSTLNGYEQEHLNLYKERLKRDVISPDGKHMWVIQYRTILIVALNLRDMKFAEDFTRKYVKRLAPDQQENMYHFSRSLIESLNNNMGKSLEHLNKINFELFAFKYDVKIRQLGIYYELGYYNEAWSTVDAFRHFLTKNKKVSDYNRDRHKKFLKYYVKVLKAKESNNKNEMYITGKMLEKESDFPGIYWLREKTKKTA